MGTEDWVFTCIKLITNTKKQRLKIWSRDWIFKNTILKRRRRRRGKIEKTSRQTKQRKQKTNKLKKSQGLLKIIIRERVLKNFRKLQKKEEEQSYIPINSKKKKKYIQPHPQKRKKKKIAGCKINKGISGPFSGVMSCVGSLPRRFPLFNFLCLLVSSVSDFRLDTGGAVVDTLGSLFSRDVGREGCCKQFLLACVCSVSSALGLALLTAPTAQALRSSAGELSVAGPRLHASSRSKPLRLDAQQALRGADLVGSAFCAIPRTVFGERNRCDYGLSLLLRFLGVLLAFLLRRMMTVQSPQKS